MVRLLAAPFSVSLFFFSLSSFQSGIAGAAQLTVLWRDNSGNEAGFKVERRMGQGGAYGPLTTTGANTTSILDQTVNAGVLYCYRVYSFNSIGASAYSNEDCATAASSLPPNTPSVEYNFNEGAGTRVVDASGNQRDGTVVGATWTTQGKYSKALSFDGGTDRVLSGLHTHALARSFLVWTKRIGPGGGNLGRIFDKRTSSTEVELLYNDSAKKVYHYMREWSGGVGNWTIPQPSPNVWHHIAVVYDASSSANSPKIYVDGISQVVTRLNAPSGSPLTNTDPYVIGNRGAGDRGWNGVLDDFRIYYIALTSAQIQAALLTEGSSP